ncbi:MAG: MltA domain-containing protein [Hyphomicrobiales bacterium]|nr:MltA domain-containing protein [Hyphomicrobiales bacterium]
MLEEERADWQAIGQAGAAAMRGGSQSGAREFFEKFFTPYLIERPSEGALVTGYFEPELSGALKPDDQHNVPVYALPDDLVMLDAQTDRASLPDDLTAARKGLNGLVPYYTRQEIEQGVISGRGLEIAWLADLHDAYVMQVQGSGLLNLPDGEQVRVGFTGKNGHPYTSVGKILIERGMLSAENATLDKVLEWLRANPAEGRSVMWRNRSYPFFRIIDSDEAANGPIGSMGAPLSKGRSLAVDPRFHRLGLPIWVSAPELQDGRDQHFQRLMIAQDSGSAIRGPVRGDIFWGSGSEAGRKAGATKHICDFTVLIPN